MPQENVTLYTSTPQSKGYPIDKSFSSCKVFDVMGSQRPQYLRLVILWKHKTTDYYTLFTQHNVQYGSLTDATV